MPRYSKAEIDFVADDPGIDFLVLASGDLQRRCLSWDTALRLPCRTRAAAHLPIPLQCLSQIAVDLTRHRQPLPLLERFYCTASFRAHHPVDATVIETAPCKGRLNRSRRVELGRVAAVVVLGIV